jgi:hypothetical protein
MAHKSIDEIIANIEPTVESVERVLPVYNFKVSERHLDATSQLAYSNTISNGRNDNMLRNRMFVHTKAFDRTWEKLGYNDDDLAGLQTAISKNPQSHPVIRGTNGVRKTRFALEGAGKSGGARIIYGDFSEHGIVYLFAAYPIKREGRHYRK